MAEVHTCLNLSNYHVVVWWSKLGPNYVAKELLALTDRCPADLTESRLKGVPHIDCVFFFFLQSRAALESTTLYSFI